MSASGVLIGRLLDGNALGFVVAETLPELVVERAAHRRETRDREPMPETTTEPTVGEDLAVATAHARHLMKHDDCWRCQADERRERLSADETAEEDD